MLPEAERWTIGAAHLLYGVATVDRTCPRFASPVPPDSGAYASDGCIGRSDVTSHIDRGDSVPESISF